jgi:hypothetical protein
MKGVFDGPGDKVHGPSGQYAGGGFGGFADENPTNIADPPKGSRFDPGPQPTRPVLAGKTEAGKGSDTPLTWQQRALQLLSKLQTAKGFKDLPSKLRNEVSALIDDAPNDAYS